MACLSIDGESSPDKSNRIFKLGAARSDRDAMLDLDSGRTPQGYEYIFVDEYQDINRVQYAW